MSDDLVKRLRGTTKWSRQVTAENVSFAVTVEDDAPFLAADALEAKDAEIERLRREVDVLTNTPKPSLPDADDLAWARDVFDRLDAKRYRWLRDAPTNAQIYSVSQSEILLRGDELDDAIDAAMEEKQNGHR